MSKLDSSTVDLSILIVSWNTCDLLRDCLISIHAHIHRYSYEIWIVDNNSSDETVAMLLKEFPEVRLIENSENVGFARANNQAFSQAKGRYVALLNPDTQLLNDAFDQMLDYMEQYEDCGIIGPRLVREDGTIQFTCARRSMSILTEFFRATSLYRLYDFQDMAEWDHENSRDVEALVGACMMVRHSILGSQILNEVYFMYGEDLELCWHIRQDLSLRVHYLSEAHVLHLGGRSAKQAAGMDARAAESDYLHMFLTRGRLAAEIARLLILFQAIKGILFFPVRWGLGNKTLAKRAVREHIKTLKLLVSLRPDMIAS
jgi:GT2 family glycosyltransferase